MKIANLFFIIHLVYHHRNLLSFTIHCKMKAYPICFHFFMFDGTFLHLLHSSNLIRPLKFSRVHFKHFNVHFPLSNIVITFHLRILFLITLSFRQAYYNSYFECVWPFKIYVCSVNISSIFLSLKIIVVFDIFMLYFCSQYRCFYPEVHIVKVSSSISTGRVDSA